MSIYSKFLFTLTFSIFISNESNLILNELIRLEQIEYRMHNGSRDEIVYVDA